MKPASNRVARRLADDLDELQKLRDIHPEEAEAIKAALVAQLMAWSAPSLTERVLD